MKRNFYQVEQSYENFVTGEKWTRRRPKLYKLWRNADKAARACSWTTAPDRNTRIDRSNAQVVIISGEDGGAR